MLRQPCPPLNLPALLDSAADVDIAERAWILGYGCHVPRGEDFLRELCIAVGILPGSDEEVGELELAGY